jgi:hypothetical protein
MLKTLCKITDNKPMILHGLRICACYTGVILRIRRKFTRLATHLQVGWNCARHGGKEWGIARQGAAHIAGADPAGPPTGSREAQPMAVLRHRGHRHNGAIGEPLEVWRATRLLMQAC